jgi:hypothetical protein
MAPDAGTEPPNPLKPPIFLVESPKVVPTSPTFIVKFVGGIIGAINLKFILYKKKSVCFYKWAGASASV